MRRRLLARVFPQCAALVALSSLSMSCERGTAPHEPAPRPVLPPPAAPRIEAPKILSIVGSNDLHGHIERLPIQSAFVARLRALRQNDGAVLLLDAGDMFQGTLESNSNEGASVIAAYNAMGYTAAALGNHDFDYGPAGDVEPGPGIDLRGALKARLTEAKFPLLSSNLLEAGSAPHWTHLETGALLLEVAGVKLGIVGGLTEETPNIVMPAYFAGLQVRSLPQSVQSAAEQARAHGARIVIAVVHAGAECKQFDDPRDASSCDRGEVARLASALPTGLVDAIVAGHTHKGVAHFLSGIAVVEAYCYGRAISRIDVTVPSDAAARPELHIFAPQELCLDPEARECVPRNYEGASIAPDAAIARLLEPYMESAKAKREEPLGVEVEKDIRGAMKEESPLGNLFADLLVQSVKGADVGIMNGGGLRAPLRKGTLTYGELYEAQPFDNRLAVMKLKGRELKAMLRAHLERERHGIASLGGVRLVASCKAGELELEIRRTNGRAIGDDDDVTVALSDYLATGGDELVSSLGIGPDRVEIRPETVRDAFAARLRARKGTLSADDPKIFDRKHPRLTLPHGRPIRCKKT